MHKYNRNSKNPIEQLLYWIVERESIRVKKKLGQVKPWTDDPILQQFRFCNVRREDDTVTRWIAKNWRDPNTTNPDLWFAMLVARYVNEPATLALIKFPVPWKAEDWLAAVEKRQAAKENVYNPAYIIATGGQARPKHLYLADFFSKFWQQREELRPQTKETLASYNTRLIEQRGMGSFMSGQVIADLKYATGCPLYGASDWWTFAASGPGSRRGLNRMLKQPVDQSWREMEWLKELSSLRAHVNKELANQHIKLHAQDMQSELCELDKYLRIYHNEGRPKQKYPGKG